MCILCLQQMFGSVGPSEPQFSIVEAQYEKGGPKAVAQMLAKSLDVPEDFAKCCMVGFHLMGLAPELLEEFMFEFQELTKGESPGMKGNFTKTFDTIFNVMSKAALAARFSSAMRGAAALGVTPGFALAVSKGDPHDPDTPFAAISDPTDYHTNPTKRHIH